MQKAAKDSFGLEKLNLDSKFPHRPGYGTRGIPVTLWANYVEMVPSAKLILYRYDIAVSPDAKGKKRAQIVRLLLETPAMTPFRSDVVTDFGSTLISRQRLAQDDMVVEVLYRSEYEDTPRERATKYSVRLQYTNTLRVSDLISYLTSTNIGETYGEKLPTVQALNIVLNHYSKLAGNHATIGASKSFSLASDSDKWTLGAGLTAIRGFFSSVRVASSRILVNINVSHGAFYDAGRLDQLVQKFQNDRGPDTRKLGKFLEKLRVRTTHLAEKIKKSGEIVIRVKVICGLATKDDGHGLQHPPRVKELGTGPHGVEFWLENQPQSSSASKTVSTDRGKQKGKKSDTPAGPAPSGRYISVFDFFKTSEQPYLLS